MKKRPIELTILSIVFSGIALYHSYQAVHSLDQPWSEPLWTQYGVLALSWMLIVFSLRASRALWFILLFPVTGIAMDHFGIHSRYVPELWAQPFLIAALLLSRPCRTALFHPSRRWWLTPSRKRAILNARICPVLGGEIVAQTVDISEGGIFIKFNSSTRWHQEQAKLKLTPDHCLQVGAYCWIRISLSEFSALACTAEVVRKTTSENGTYPAGIGLRFVGLTAQDRKVLAKFLKSASSDLVEVIQQSAVAPTAVAEAPAAAGKNHKAPVTDQLAV